MVSVFEAEDISELFSLCLVVRVRERVVTLR